MTYSGDPEDGDESLDDPGPHGYHDGVVGGEEVAQGGHAAFHHDVQDLLGGTCDHTHNKCNTNERLLDTKLGYRRMQCTWIYVLCSRARVEIKACPANEGS